MRICLFCVAASSFVCIAIVGCGPAVSDSELGTPVYEVPTVAGADQPYAFPTIPPPEPGSEADKLMRERMKMAGKMPGMGIRPDLTLPPMLRDGTPPGKLPDETPKQAAAQKSMPEGAPPKGTLQDAGMPKGPTEPPRFGK